MNYFIIKKKVSVVDHSTEFTVVMKTHRVGRRKNPRGIKEPPAASAIPDQTSEEL